MAELTEPLRNIFRGRRGEPPEVLATMSRRRFITFEAVTVLTALLTCFTLLLVSLLQNAELSGKILNWGNTASCILNATSEHQLRETNETQPRDWIDVVDFLLQLRGQCSAAPNFSGPP